MSILVNVVGQKMYVSSTIDTDNHSGSPSTICSLGDGATAVLSTLFGFSHSVLPLSNWYV